MAVETVRVVPGAGGRRVLFTRRLPTVIALGAVAVLAVGPSPLLAGPLALAVVSGDLVRVDVESRRLPNALVLPCYPAALAGIAVDGILTGASSVVALAAGASWFVFFLLLNLGGGMGMGDVKLAGVLGLCLGSIGVLPAVAGIALAFLTGGVAGMVVIARRVGGRHSRMPFGPFLLAGFWLGLALSPALATAST